MCGISGIIRKDGQKVVSEDIEKMNNLARHRGPDDEGYYFGDCFAFGNRRLAVLDLSPTGHQPMSYKDDLVITYNGEVYNYLEIKQELLKDKYTFNSDTDTEVVLAAYDRWGFDCVKKFNGMWAFAIYDKKKNLVFCSRDRFGIKPFCYSDTGSRFMFASEHKQIASAIGHSAGLNYNAAIDFLVIGMMNHNENTFFNNIVNLRGGHNLYYNLYEHSYHIERWYDLTTVEIDSRISYEEAREKFFSLFENSVMLRLRSDANLGMCLSGGIDSSAIACMARKVIPKSTILTIASCYTDKEIDEQEYIDEVLKRTSFSCNKIFPDMNELLDNNVIDTIVYHQDQPLLSTSQFAEYSVFKDARNNKLVVMLDGQGADEYLAGYGEFINAFYNKLIYSFSILRLGKELLSRKRLINRSIPLLIKHALYYSLGKHILNVPIPEWISLPGEIRKQNEFRSPFSDIKAKDINIHSLSKLHLLSTSLPFQLHSEDRNSMLSSIESRLPFLDYQLVEFVLGLRDGFKIKNGYTKAILRDSLAETLPDKIRYRKSKIGFAMPDEQWAKNNAKQLKDELLNAIRITDGFINNKIIEKFDRYISGKDALDPVFFKAISFARWIKVFRLN